MSTSLEERLAVLEDLVPKLHAANYAQTIVLSAMIRFISEPERLFAILSGMSESFLLGNTGNVQGLTPEQKSIAADVVDSIAQNIKPA